MVHASSVNSRHWFYEDYLRPLNPLLPQLSQRSFSHLIVASSPLYGHLTDDDYDEVWDQYCRYKRMVPCCGGILINADGDKVGGASVVLSCIREMVESGWIGIFMADVTYPSHYCR